MKSTNELLTAASLPHWDLELESRINAEVLIFRILTDEFKLDDIDLWAYHPNAGSVLFLETFPVKKFPDGFYFEVDEHACQKKQGIRHFITAMFTLHRPWTLVASQVHPFDDCLSIGNDGFSVCAFKCKECRILNSPSPKAPQLTDMLEQLFGRSTAISKKCCISCKTTQNIWDSWKYIDAREYRISGNCPKCFAEATSPDVDEPVTKSWPHDDNSTTVSRPKGKSRFDRQLNPKGENNGRQ